MGRSSLETLPPELLLEIVTHLPLRRNSIRPHSSLGSLAASSRHLRSALAGAVCSTVRVASHTDAQALITHAPASVKSRVRSLHLEPVTPPWTIDTLEPLLASLDALGELHCSGVQADPFALVELLTATRASPAIERLELDFARTGTVAEPHWTVRADYPLTAPARAPGSPTRCPSLSHALSEPSLGADLSLSSLPRRCSALRIWTRACLALCPELRVLTLRNFALSLATLPASASCLERRLGSSIPERIRETQLQTLELEAVELDDETLAEVLAASNATLKTLSLRGCTGFTGAGLIEAVKAAGPKLRHLELVAADPPSVSPASSPLPARTRTPPPAHRSTPPPPAPPPPLAHVVDALLPHLAHLASLSLSSPAHAPALLSPAALASLSMHTPHLRALYLHGPHPATDILPLVQRSSDVRLPALRVLALHPAVAPACDGAAEVEDDWGETAATVEELWAAALQGDVQLEGAAFVRARERLEWATGTAEELARQTVGGGEVSGSSGASGGRRRKRPSLL